jgi:thiol-disulfide isomerase/thioredoxin
MRPAILTLVAAASLFAADPAPGPGPQLPRKAPELMIQMPGKQISLSQFKGFVVGLAFMSTTCPHCQKLAGVMSGLQQEYASKGVQMLGVVFNPEANTELFVFTSVFAKNMFPVGMSVDATVASFVQHPPGIHYIPMMCFIDKQGIIRDQHLGINDANFFDEKFELQNIRNALDKILKEPVVQLPRTDAKPEAKKK